MRTLTRRALQTAAMIAALPSLTREASAAVTASSYFGGTGTDGLSGVAVGADGSIYIAGNSDSSALGGSSAHRLSPGGGFVARLDVTGSRLVWLSWIEPAGKLGIDTADRAIVVTGDHLTALSSDGASVAWKSAPLGAPIKAFARSASGAIAVLAGARARVIGADGVTVLLDIADVGRSNPSSVAIEPLTNDLFVSGDHNAGYGTCGGPWRSPFIFRYDRTAQRTWKLYDYPGQDACDVGLAADSFFTQLSFQDDGTLYVTGGSDGGNTVLGKQAADLRADSPALAGACFPSACYGWKGAAAPRYVGRMKPGAVDFERSTFIVGHFNRAPVGCSCDVPQDDGTGARPNSAGLDEVFPTSTGDVVGAGSAAWHFPTVNPWFPAAAYTPGYPAVVAVLDHDLKTMKMATLLPGTAALTAAAFRNGKLVMVGSAPDNAAWTAPAGQEALAEATITAKPAGAALQARFGGGSRDGFIYVACVGEPDCANASTPDGSAGAGGGDAGGPDGAAPSAPIGKDAAPGNEGSPTGSDPRDAEPSAGCACGVTPRNGGNPLAVLVSLLVAVSSRRRARRAVRPAASGNP